jgi:spore coat protein U-like protein
MKKNWLTIAMAGCMGLGLVMTACGAEDSAAHDNRVVPVTIGGEVAIRAATTSDIQHACTHAVNPAGFQNVTAATSGDGSSVTDHVSYNVTLPSAGGGSYSGYVALETEENEASTLEYAIYTDPSVTSVTVVPATGGSAVPLEWSTSISSELCGAPSADSGIPTYGTPDHGLSYVRTYLLQPETEYRITITHSSSPVLAIFENLDEED